MRTRAAGIGSCFSISNTVARRYSLPDAIPYVIGNDNTTGYRIGDSAAPGIGDDEGPRLKIMEQPSRVFVARAFSIQQIEGGSSAPSACPSARAALRRGIIVARQTSRNWSVGRTD